MPPANALAQQAPVKIWEFSPYDVGVWYTFDSSVHLSDVAKQAYLKQLAADMDRTFRAAWSTQFSELSPELSRIAQHHFDSFNVQDLTSNELVLVVSSQHEQSKTLRTYTAAVETLTEIWVTEETRQRLAASAERVGVAEDSPTAALLQKCVVDEGGHASIEEKLVSGSIAGALLPQADVPRDAEGLRSLVTMLPWQTESIFRKHDKLFFLRIRAEGDEFVFQVRELDCPMQFAGPAFEASTSSWTHAPRVTSRAFTRAFAPVARVEDAESRTANLRLRAGGLIIHPENPASVGVGDIMQPIVRRDDRHGVPTLLEPLSWTFAAITGSDGVKMTSNVYSYSGGPGLQGRKNRRTRRVLLRVRPLYDETDIKIAVRGADGQSQSGCFVYRRDLLTEEFEYLGRTDWRGRFTVAVPDTLSRFLPEAVRKERYLQKREAEKKRAEAEAQAEESTEGAEAPEENNDNSQVAADETKEPTAEPSEEETYDPDADADALPLNFALMQIYIKSGDTVLAKLPMVPGLKSLEVAELPDDSRRLRAEAFVRGFQGEILDLIGLRNLLAAQVQLYVKDNKLDLANTSLERLRGLRNYNEMADELERIQRVMLDENSGAISLSAKNRIDRMFQTTRDMLQKYLQDNLLRDSEQLFKRASESSSTSAVPPSTSPASGDAASAREPAANSVVFSQR